METYVINKALKKYRDTLSEFGKRLEDTEIRQKVKEWEAATELPDFWNDNKSAQQVLQDLKNAKEKLNTHQSLTETCEGLQMLLEDAHEFDDEMQNEVEQEYLTFEKAFQNFEIEMLLSSENDSAPAIIEINPGAGGTESQDWAEMLYRMYIRFAEKNGYKTEVLNYQNGDEAGIKNAVIRLSGSYAYGRMKAESGVHRLVRISPFDSNSRRHTSFASVLVTPELEAAKEIEIKESDLKIDTFRSSGAGGQSVNTTDSAVRITHVPTGIVVSCQNERSQIANRDRALNMLKSKLFQKQQEEEIARKAALAGNKSEIGFGSQIRSYVFHPYSLVKDHRTHVEVGNVQAVVDGDIMMFIDAYLQSQLK